MKKRNDTLNKKKKRKCTISKKFAIYVKKDLLLMMAKKYFQVKDHCHYTGKCRGAAHDICNLRNKIPKEIPVVFHNGFTYDYHFIIKELAEEFEGQFECLGEYTKKYITFLVPIKKELDNRESTIYKSLLIDLNLCQAHYQVLSIIYLKDFIVVSAQILNLVLTI